MDCRVVQELISPYIDGELDRERARQLEAHVESCSECRQRLEEMKAVVQMVGALEEKELPDDFADRLQTRLEAEQVTGMIHRKRVGFSSWMKWVGMAAAAAVIVLAIRVLSLNGLMYTSPQEKGRTESAAPENMSKSFVADSRDEGGTGPSDTQADAADKQQELDRGDVGASEYTSETSEQAQEADGYIKSDKVELMVQDVCINPQTLMIRAVQHGIDVVDQTQDSITLKVTSIEQRKALYRELELLGVVKEVGTNFESDTVTIVIVEQE